MSDMDFGFFPRQTNPTVSRLVHLAIGAGAAAVLLWGLSTVLPAAVDWHTAFRPAALKLLEGRSPYEVEGFFNPVWALFPLLPFAMLPEALGRAALFVASLLALAYTAHRLGARLPAILLLLLSPPALHGFLNGNIDWLALLGLLMPPQYALFFLAIKPQIGVGIAIFLAIEAWRDGGWRLVARQFLPVTSACLLSIAVYGFWPARSAVEIGLWWNASLWPTSIPLGLALLAVAFRRREARFSMAASPFLSPYILLHSWIVALFALVESLPALSAVVAALWLLALL